LIEIVFIGQYLVLISLMLFVSLIVRDGIRSMDDKRWKGLGNRERAKVCQVRQSDKRATKDKQASKPVTI